MLRNFEFGLFMSRREFLNEVLSLNAQECRDRRPHLREQFRDPQ